MNTTIRVRNNEYAKTLIVIALIVGIVLGFFFGLQLILNNPVPVRVVESGSMCIPYGRLCNGWLSLNHPFARTLHKGDLIIIQGVDPKDLNTNYPNSDIIIYENPTDPTSTPIVHRIVTSYEVNGTLYFQTKGDGNDDKYPQMPPVREYDSNTIWTTGEGVPQDLVAGRVVMRIPYFGWITLLLKDNPWGLPLIIAVILLLVVLEFIIPIIKGKKSKTERLLIV